MANFIAKGPNDRQQGYILLCLVLFITLLSIASLAFIERFDFQMKRDREEELIHRGVEYSRAVRRFVRQFGRYPESIEELENTSNTRFLRRRYKDPITGRDFQLLRANDLHPSSNILPPKTGDTGTASSGQKSPLTAPGSDGADRNTSSTAQDFDNSSDGNSPDSATDPTASAARPVTASEKPSPPPGTPVFGSGPVVGVVSASHEKTIREFNRKEHYNEWLFLYDPTTDSRALPQGPNQSLIKPAAQANLLDQQKEAEPSSVNKVSH